MDGGSTPAYGRFSKVRGNGLTTNIITSDDFNQADNGVSDFIQLPTIEESYHLYGVIWTEESVKFYIDSIDNIVFAYNKPANANGDNWPFSRSFYFVMDLAVGEEFDESIVLDETMLSATMEVDYVRVYHP